MPPCLLTLAEHYRRRVTGAGRKESLTKFMIPCTQYLYLFNGLWSTCGQAARSTEPSGNGREMLTPSVLGVQPTQNMAIDKSLAHRKTLRAHLSPRSWKTRRSTLAQFGCPKRIARDLSCGDYTVLPWEYESTTLNILTEYTPQMRSVEQGREGEDLLVKCWQFVWRPGRSVFAVEALAKALQPAISLVDIRRCFFFRDHTGNDTPLHPS